MSVWSTLGSSPLARGLQGLSLVRPDADRIIPARAGFTRTCRNEYVPRQDHPRSRGVYHTLAELGRPSAGSSPLARGLRSRQWWSFQCFRIIPARAGFTPSGTRLKVTSTDHPRSRGVYTYVTQIDSTPAGSSPLARGLLGPPIASIPLGGIIPARAGFTLVDPWNPND